MIVIYQHENGDWGYWALDTLPDTTDYKILANYLIYYRSLYPNIDIDYDTYVYMNKEDGYYRLEGRLA